MLKNNLLIATFSSIWKLSTSFPPIDEHRNLLMSYSIPPPSILCTTIGSTPFLLFHTLTLRLLLAYQSIVIKYTGCSNSCVAPYLVSKEATCCK